MSEKQRPTPNGYFPSAEEIAAEEGATPTAEQLAAVNIYQARREEHHDNPNEATRAKIIEAAHEVEASGWITRGHTLASEVTTLWERTA